MSVTYVIVFSRSFQEFNGTDSKPTETTEKDLLMKRREFIESGAKAFFAAPLILNSRFSLFTPPSASPIVSVFDSRASALHMAPGRSPNFDGVVVDKILSYEVKRTRISNMVDTAVMKLTGRPDVGKAWESLFPEGHPKQDTTIAIKINLSYGEKDEENDWSETHCPFGPKVALSDAIILGLTQMLDGTFPMENIVVFDVAYSSEMRNKFPLIQGYRQVQADGMGIRKDNIPGTYRMHWVAPRHPFEIPPNAPRFIAAPDFPEEYRAPQRIIPPAYENDFTINVAIAKTHREGGVTGIMKNTYGCTDNPVGTHGAGNEWRHEDSPYPGSRRCAPAFYKAIDQHSPTILNVLDALSGIYHYGPLSGKVFLENTIAVSRDPVAIDTYALDLVNKHRKKKGHALLSTDEGRAADGFPNASVLKVASEKHELGSMSMDRLDRYDLSDTRDDYQIPVLQRSQSRVGDVYRKGSRYRLDVRMDDSKRSHLVESKIEDIKGKVVKSYKPKRTGRSHLAINWNHRSDDRQEMEKGFYIWHVMVDGIRHSRVIHDL